MADTGVAPGDFVPDRLRAKLWSVAMIHKLMTTPSTHPAASPFSLPERFALSSGTWALLGVMGGTEPLTFFILKGTLRTGPLRFVVPGGRGSSSTGRRHPSRRTHRTSKRTCGCGRNRWCLQNPSNPYSAPGVSACKRFTNWAGSY